MLRIAIILSLTLFFMLSVGAQKVSIQYCNTVKIENEWRASHPELHQLIDDANAKLEAETKIENLNYGVKKGTTIVIPVVFHVIHNYGSENISDDQIYDAIAVMTEDFRAMNSDLQNVSSNFYPIAADVEIEFRLAKKDPSGNCHSGINRIASNLTYQGDSDMKDLIQWPRNKYLNIWVCADAAGAAGYTFTPGTAHNNPSEDGIVVQHNYTGSIGTSSQFTSRVLTHEVGHWLNLRHTWGNTNSAGVDCSGSDQVSDTPQTQGWTSCTIDGESCGSIDNVENYMEYSYCGKMFTQGQKSRMLAAANSSTAQRNQLWQSSNLIATGVVNGDVLCQADFNSNKTIICEGDSVLFTDQSFYSVTDLNWTFQGGSPLNAVEDEVWITYNQTGSFDVELIASDGFDDVTTVLSDYITVLPLQGQEGPVIEGFENTLGIPSSEWMVLNPDDDLSWELNFQVAASGTKSIYINNRFNDAGQLDEILSSTYDVSGFQDVAVSFDYAYAKRNTTNDEKLRFYVGSNCGESWALRKSLVGTNFPTAPNTSTNWAPNASQWETVIVNNISSSYLISNFRFKFVFESDGGNNVYIDNINIYDPLATGIDEIGNIRSSGLYPNPNRGEFTLQLALNEAEIMSFQIMDLTGRVIQKTQPEWIQVGSFEKIFYLESAPSGIYLLEILGTRAQKFVKLIKE